jgi:hypothetical protein
MLFHEVRVSNEMKPTLYINKFLPINRNIRYNKLCMHISVCLLIATHCIIGFIYIYMHTTVCSLTGTHCTYHAFCQHIPYCRRCPWLHAVTRWLEYRIHARIAPGCRGRCTPGDRVLVAPRWDELVGSSGTRIPDAVPLDSPRHIYSETYNAMTSFHDCCDSAIGSRKIAYNSLQMAFKFPSLATFLAPHYAIFSSLLFLNPLKTKRICFI